jgi:PAS domain S-box-containing protein
MSTDALNLSPPHFAAAFPFHIALDERMRLLQIGSVLARLCPAMVEGSAFGEHFDIQRPSLPRLDVEALRKQGSSLFLLRHRDGTLRLRGQFVAQDDRLFFLGSPWVSTMSEVTQLGLSLSDFAVHDPVVDLLFLLQTKNKSLDDAQKLARRLSASQQLLAEAQSLARLGSWVLDPATGEIECSDEASHIYGLTPTGRNPTLGQMLALVPPTERESLGEALERAVGDDAPVEMEHAAHLPDGTRRWVHVSLQRSLANGVTRVCAAVRDETARKTSALRLARAHDVARELAADVEPDDAIAFILSAVCTQQQWPAAACWLADDATRLRCLGAWAMPGDGAAGDFCAALRGSVVERPDAALEAAWAAARPVARSLDADAPSTPRAVAAGAAGLRAALVVPVMAGDRLAALEFFDREALEADGEIEAFLLSVASHLAQYLRRRQAEAALRQANANLNEFTYVVSHDMRAPLRGIADLVDWIGEDLGPAAPPQVRHNLQRAGQRIERMEGLIDDLLSYARAGRAATEHTLVDLEALVREILEIQAAPPGFEVRLAIAVQPFQATRTPLATVLRNLLANAIKHHDRPSGHVRVEARPDGTGFCEISVTDDGPGVAPGARAGLFTLFETTSSSAQGGSGIGLALARRLIDVHGGRIEVESPVADGRGTCLRFWWPLLPGGSD